MRHYVLIAVIVLSANSAFAQAYPQYQPQVPQQEANVANYPVAPTTYPQVYVPPAPQPVQPQQYYEVRPSDAGQSVVTDVRQMNF